MAREYSDILGLLKNHTNTDNGVEIYKAKCISTQPFIFEKDDIKYKSSDFKMFKSEGLTLSETDVGKTFAIAELEDYFLILCRLEVI